MGEFTQKIMRFTPLFFFFSVLASVRLMIQQEVSIFRCIGAGVVHVGICGAISPNI